MPVPLPIHLTFLPDAFEQEHPPAPYDPEAFADLLCTDQAAAAYALRQLNEPQRTCQALAYVVWLERFGLTTTLDEVCAAWEPLIHGPQT